MAVKFETASYVRSHGSEPKGRGCWAFRQTDAREAGGGEWFFSPSWMSYTEARAWARKQVQGAGYQDATVEVGA